MELLLNFNKKMTYKLAKLAKKCNQTEYGNANKEN